MRSLAVGRKVHFRFAAKSCVARRRVPHSTGRLLDSARQHSELLESGRRLSDAMLAEKRLNAAESHDPEWLERWRTARNRVLRAAEDYATALQCFRELFPALTEHPLNWPWPVDTANTTGAIKCYGGCYGRACDATPAAPIARSAERGARVCKPRKMRRAGEGW